MSDFGFSAILFDPVLCFSHRGPGGYVKPVIDLVGESGRIYALDINPRAIQMVKKIIAKNLMRNVETILSDCSTGCPTTAWMRYCCTTSLTI
jgi:hypothetical protein